MADKFKIEGKNSLAANMRSVLKQLKYENGNISFHVNNSILKEQYLQAKADIIPLLRERLFTENINLDVILDEIKVEKVAFTGKEKFEKMAKINPQILELKKTLGLDLEF